MAPSLASRARQPARLPQTLVPEQGFGPTRAMYRYLTDRVGNYPEIEPYFPLWRALRIEEGLLAVIAIEHDAVSKSVARIPKGTDGRALL